MPRAAEDDLGNVMAFHREKFLLHLTGLRVVNVNGLRIAFEVGCDVELPVVGGEIERIPPVVEIPALEELNPVAVLVRPVHVAADQIPRTISLHGDEPHDPIVIGHPELRVTGWDGYSTLRPVLDVELVDIGIEEVAVVVGNQYMIGVTLQSIDNVSRALHQRDTPGGLDERTRA